VSYVKPSGAAIDVLELVIGAQRYQSDKEKARILIDIFFPTPPTPETSEDDNVDASRQGQTLEWLQLTKHKVKRAIFRSSSDKALGLDRISFWVWKEL
jgi:hypothetical protein